MKIYGIRRFEFSRRPSYDVGTALFELDPPIIYDKCGIECLKKNSWLINRVLKINITHKEAEMFGKLMSLPYPEFEKKNNNIHFSWRWKDDSYPDLLISDWFNEISINENDVISFESDDDALLWYEMIKDHVKGVKEL